MRRLGLLVWLWMGACVYCAWNQGLVVAESVAEGTDMHYNPLKQVAHIIWCEGELSQLNYRQVFSNGTTSTPLVLSQTGKCGPSYITGSGDGSKLYVVTTGGKNQLSGNMGLDVYFVESANAGLSWSAPTLIPRDTNKDLHERVAAAIFVVHATGRLWVFHRRTQYLTNIHSIAAASRSSGSALFQRESVIVTLPSPHTTQLPAVAYNMNGKDVVLHMTYIERLKSPYSFLMYVRSTNSGLTWSTPVILEEIIDDSNPLPNLSLTTDPTVLNSPLYLTYAPYPLASVFMRVSADYGRTWLVPTSVSDSVGSTQLEAKVCGKSNGQLAGLLVQTDSGLEFGTFDSDSMTRRGRTGPLSSSEVVKLAKLACAVNEDLLFAQALLTVDTGTVAFFQYRDPRMNPHHLSY